ncbi:MAG: cellulase family glycosylhydrolase [Deltaproteobacteria bacterium]|nr:cellulase family glycosylhydrolase [Candidatus Zymogenaceae bacterium]
MKLAKLHTEGLWFADEWGRKVILRGVNLGGDCKVPYPDGGTNIPSDFSDHREVSFTGRPFPIDEAKEHLTRLKSWGVNVLRLLTTWEAVEHRGPGEYDTEYLDYYAEVCRLAGEYGMYVFVDFHQDVWSRMSGGDGAPAWLFETVGLDFTKFHRADAAIVMQHAYDYDDPRPRQEDNYPIMCWGSNMNYPVNGIMWTLFFAGTDFAPQFTVEGKNIQDYMQEHYLGCLREVGKRVADMPHVLGFDTLNEPNPGWVGKFLDATYIKLDRERDIVGVVWEPISCLFSSHGNPVTLPFTKVRYFPPGLATSGMQEVNKDGVSIWLDGRTDPFQEAGAWRMTDDGYEIIKNDFFRTAGGRDVDFGRDYLTPFFHRVAETVREIRPDWMLFVERPPEDLFYRQGLPEDIPENSVNATHWYDMATLVLKRFIRWVTLDYFFKRLVLGLKGIERMYRRQLGLIGDSSNNIPGGVPSLVGEFGIHFDLAGGKAYRRWAKGKRGPGIWKDHITALDAMYNALDALMFNATLWNYTASNSNDLTIGDGWNQEDLSVYSRDQKDNPDDINSGGRALEGFVRPYPQYVQGTPKKIEFRRKMGLFTLVFDADPKIDAPTEIFVPNIQYPNGFRVEAGGLFVEEERAHQLVRIRAAEPGEVTVKISPG